MQPPKAGDLLSLLQLAVALNLAYGGVSYFIESEMARAKFYMSELRSLFNSETDPQTKMHYGNALLHCLSAYVKIQTVDKQCRPAVLVVIFALLAVLSLIFLVVATWMAQENAGHWLVAVSIMMPILPSGFFAAVLIYSLSVRKSIQALLAHPFVLLSPPNYRKTN